MHTAPGFGEEDHEVMKGTGVPTVCPIDAECKFTDEVSDYAGIFVKDADKAIMDRLKAEGKLVRREQILHAYPHCWRCAHPLIYRAIGSWFVKIDPIKPKMLAANSKINWVPAHIKDGRFGKWLEKARTTGRSRAAATGATPADLEMPRLRQDALRRLALRAREALGRQGSRTCTSTSSTR